MVSNPSSTVHRGMPQFPYLRHCDYSVYFIQLFRNLNQILHEKDLA